MSNKADQWSKIMKFFLQTRSDKSAVNFLSRIAGVAALVLIASAPAAFAQIYNFTFTGGGGMDATGTINISSGVAQSGSINVTGVPLEASPNTLITAAGSLIPGSGVAKDYNGDNVSYDNLVNFANDPVLDGNGLGFGSSQYNSDHYYTLIGLNGGDEYGNYVGPGVYTLFVGEAQLDGNGNVIAGEGEYVYHWESGSLTLTPVPEPATLGLVSAGLLGLLALRRRKA